MRVNGAQIITRLLERQGITTVTGIPGGANLPLYDALGQSKLRHILARHEQGAGFIAQGMARVTGKAAVCFGTSGPGATNLITAIADAKVDSIPLVVITGQVVQALIGTDAFQEVDTYGLTVPITKHNYLVRSAAELLRVIPEAFEVAESGRPGPVVIDVPKDVQLETIEIDNWPEPGQAAPSIGAMADELEQIRSLLAGAQRPILYAGGGVIASNAGDRLVDFARRASIPVTLTLQGLGAFPADDPLYLGMLGMHAARATALALDEADLLIAVGVRFDDRATGKVSEFCRHATVVHIDIDPSEIGKIKPANLGVVADARRALEQILDGLESQPRASWLRRIAELKANHALSEPSEGGLYQPGQLLHDIASMASPSCVVTTDVGQHQMWVAQYYPFKCPRTLLTSGGLGTMGFGLPAAIGAALAKPNEQVVCITGDGSLLMNLQELATLAETGCNVKIVVMNNQHLGLVRQQQTLFYGSRYQASRFDAHPDFPAIARGFGIEGLNLNNLDNPREALLHALRKPGPALINVPIHPMANVLPMVPPGAANRDMIESAPEVCHA